MEAKNNFAPDLIRRALLFLRVIRDALDFVYRHLTCSHALRPDEGGRFSNLVYHLMDATTKGYAVHEILWEPKVRRNEGARVEHFPPDATKGSSA